MGGRSIAISARSELLGFRRDLLTAAAYGVDEFLFVYGDRTESGARSDDLTVRSMIREARAFSESHAEVRPPVRVGVTSGLRPLPAWKQDADFLFAQVAFSIGDLLAWRRRSTSPGRSTPGSVIASAPMARKLRTRSRSSRHRRDRRRIERSLGWGRDR